MKLSQKLEWLFLKTDIPVYRIAKDNDIPITTLQKYRCNERSIEKMSLGNAEKLSDYADALLLDEIMRK